MINGMVRLFLLLSVKHFRETVICLSTRQNRLHVRYRHKDSNTVSQMMPKFRWVSHRNPGK